MLHSANLLSLTFYPYAITYVTFGTFLYNPVFILIYPDALSALSVDQRCPIYQGRVHQTLRHYNKHQFALVYINIWWLKYCTPHLF